MFPLCYAVLDDKASDADRLRRQDAQQRAAGWPVASVGSILVFQESRSRPVIGATDPSRRAAAVAAAIAAAGAIAATAAGAAAATAATAA